MNRHGALQCGVRRAGVDNIEDTVDRLVAPGAEDRRAEDQLCLGIDGDLHKTARLALLDRASDPSHQPLRGEQSPAPGARLPIGHPDTAEWRIGVEGITQHTIADASIFAVKEVGGDDLEIVIRGVGECASPVAVAKRPDPRDIGGKAVIDFNVAASVDRHAGPVEPQIIGIRAAPDREQHIRTDNFRVALAAGDADRDTLCMRRQGNALRVRAYGDTLGFEISRIACETSASSRATSCGLISTTDTAAPNRRYIWANSSPT